MVWGTSGGVSLLLLSGIAGVMAGGRAAMWNVRTGERRAYMENQQIEQSCFPDTGELPRQPWNTLYQIFMSQKRKLLPYLGHCHFGSLFICSLTYFQYMHDLIDFLGRLNEVLSTACLSQ